MNNINHIIQQYFSAAEQMKHLEKQLKTLRPTIEDYVKTTVGTQKISDSTTIKIGDFMATLTPAKRETFNLKEAKLLMNEETIKPFISVSEYTTLKVNKVAA